MLTQPNRRTQRSYAARYSEVSMAWVGKPLGTHILWHSNATALARRVRAFVRQQVLGHASIETTEGCVHGSADLAAPSADVLPEMPPLAPPKPKTFPAPTPQPGHVAERPALPTWTASASAR